MLIKVRVFPESKKAKIEAKAGDELMVWVKAKAKRGEANREVLQALAEHFAVPAEKIKLLRGAHNRNKLFEIESPR